MLIVADVAVIVAVIVAVVAVITPKKVDNPFGPQSQLHPQNDTRTRNRI